MWKDAEFSLRAWAARGCWTGSCFQLLSFQLQDSSKSFTGLEPLTYLVKWKFASLILVTSGLILVMDIKKLLMLKRLRPELRKTKVLSQKEYLLILTNNVLKNEKQSSFVVTIRIVVVVTYHHRSSRAWRVGSVTFKSTCCSCTGPEFSS